MQNLNNSLKSRSPRESSLLRWLRLVQAEYGDQSLEAGLVLLDLQDEYDSTGEEELAEQAQRQANAILIRHIRHSKFRTSSALLLATRKRRDLVCTCARNRSRNKRH